MYGTEQIEQFEEFIGLGPTQAAKFLGCKYTTYAEYKNDRRPKEKQRPAPDCILFSIEAHTLLTKPQLKRLKNDRALIEIGDVEYSQDLIQVFEDYTSLGPTYAAQLLGRKYNTYSEYKNGRQSAIPSYIAYSIQALMLLSRSQLRQSIKERLDHDKLLKMGRLKTKELEARFSKIDRRDMPVLLGCAANDYEAYRAAEDVMPDRISDCCTALINLSEKTAKEVVEDRTEGEGSTVPAPQDLADLQKELKYSNKVGAELFIVDLKRYSALKKGKELPDDVASLLYALTSLPKAKILAILKDLP